MKKFILFIAAVVTLGLISCHGTEKTEENDTIVVVEDTTAVDETQAEVDSTIVGTLNEGETAETETQN